MGIAAKKDFQDYISFEEFLQMEECSEEKHEFFDGELVPVVSATPRHASLVSNAQFSVQNGLRKKGSRCKVYDSSLLVYFPSRNHGAYPDIVTVCGPLELYKGRVNAVLNPLLVIEVLSPHTEDYDRGSKFGKYRSLPAFQEYVLISQDRPKVESWYKMEENIWRISHAEGMEASIHLYSLEIDLPLSEIYHLVEMEEES